MVSCTEIRPWEERRCLSANVTVGHWKNSITTTTSLQNRSPTHAPSLKRTIAKIETNTVITGSRSRSPQPHPPGRAQEAQAEGTIDLLPQSPGLSLTSTSDPRPCSSLILHGRQVPRLLHHHHRLLTRPDRRRLRRLLAGPLPAHRR